MIPRRSISPAFAILVLLPLSAVGQTTDAPRHDSSLPIAIAADNMEVEQDARRATFIGDVDVEQGDLTLRADKLVVHYREDEDGGSSVHFIEAQGDVFFATLDETAQGDEGAYDVDAGIVTLAGNVVLTNAEAVLRGDGATMNLETGQSLVTGGDERVNVLFNADGN